MAGQDRAEQVLAVLLADSCMIKEMARVATECIKHPDRPSIWLPAEGRYVCPDTEEARLYAQQLATVQREQAPPDRSPPPRRLNAEFKLVFVAAFGGTLLFTILCIALTMYAGKEPHPAMERLVSGMFDLVKIGFGAVVGLLGAKSLQGKEEASPK